MKQIEADLQITPEQAQLIEALFSAKSRRAAAVACNISSATLYRWMNDPKFQEALNRAESQVVKDATTKLISEFDHSIDTLIVLRKDGAPSDSVKLKSAVAILQIGREMHEAQLIEERLSTLENLVVELAERVI